MSWVWMMPGRMDDGDDNNERITLVIGGILCLPDNDGGRKRSYIREKNLIWPGLAKTFSENSKIVHYLSGQPWPGEQYSSKITR